MAVVSVEGFHPVVRDWFAQRFDQPTEPQRDGWPAIASGRDTLIAAPTGSGKTLAAFLACLDELIKRGIEDELPETTQILYVSPLKALSNDIHRNLQVPLTELADVAAKRGIEFPPIRAAVRTGDTPASERQRMAKKPPHILVTTPESFYILLTSKSGRRSLSHVRTVIVDEIHAVAGDKRGAHLALSLERLRRLVHAETGRAPVRVGLSATQRPIERIGRMLVGNNRPLPHIVDSGHARTIDIAIELTDDELGPIASHEHFGRVYDRIAELVASHETTLVFVNTRRLVERVSHHLEQRLGEDQIVAHHGSMSRKLRLKAEQRLKSGEVRCAVATASLELGIDVGSVDLVVQIGSPRSIATLLQRIGRSGHSLGKTPKGRLFAMTRDQLVECAALVRAVHAKNLDAIVLREAPLDVMAQQVVAASACEDFAEDDLFDMVSSAANYADLERRDFDAMLEVLSEGLALKRGRTSAHLHRDRINSVIKGRRGARLAAITSGGAIPDNANYAVVQYPEETRVGDLDEDFAIESMAGDIFLLGNTSWRVRRVESGRVIVEDAQGASPTVPFWLGEAPARTPELSEEVSALRAEIDARLASMPDRQLVAEWLAQAATMPMHGAQQMVAYLDAGRQSLGVIPNATNIVAERFFDEAGGMQLVIHAPIGGRVNRAWGLALRKRFCRGFNFELQAAATDDGIVISLGQPHSFPLETVFEFLRSATVRELLIQAMLPAPMFGVRWRWNATRSLTILRRRGGKRVPPHILRMRSDDMLGMVFPEQQACLENVVGDIELPDHPLIKETVRDCLTEAMDIDALEQLLRDIESGAVKVHARDTVEPSPLSHELLNANPYAFLDDAPLEERRARAVPLRRGLANAVGDDLGALDAAAIVKAEEQATPVVRNADELHDAMLSLMVVPESWVPKGWAEFLPALIEANRATVIVYVNRRAWVAAERLPIVAAGIDDVSCEPPLPPLPFEVQVPSREKAIEQIVAAHMDHVGPRTVEHLATVLGLQVADVDAATLALESSGVVMRGHFTKTGRSGVITEWCNRRILARIHRLTLSRLRAEIQPVPAAALMRFLFRWQRLHAGGQLMGIDGLGRIVEQLQGYECAAGAWEREVLPARLHGYDQAWLDSLCLSGEVSCFFLSPRKRNPDDQPNEARHTPTRAAPIAVMARNDLDWLRAPASKHAELYADASVEGASLSLSDAARKVHDALAARGASFLRDIAQHTELEPAEIENGLWELVGAGLATADGFASLRILVDRPAGGSRSHFDGPQRGRVGSANRRWQAALKKARKRDNSRPGQAVRSLPTAAGRWWLLGAPRPEAMDAEASARQLLMRYGVVFRDLLVREATLPPWRDLLVALRRMEAKGEIRGGRFVNGFVGEQFALPEAVEGLRAMRKPAERLELVRVAATDPLNLVGITSPGPKVHAVIGNAILFRNGVPIASLESGEMKLRCELEPGERVDDELVYHAPPAAKPAVPTTLRLI